MTVFLVNAAHVKQVPGRKTDKADARGLAKLRRHGVWQASFIPPVAQRDLRDLTRDRTKRVQERRREVNRVQGGLERAPIKRGSVATDIMGVSARAIVAALVEGRADPAALAEWAQGRMRSPIPVLEQALPGLVRDQHRQLLTLPVAPIDFLDEQLDTRSGAMTHGLIDLGAGAPPAALRATVGPAAGAAAPDPSSPPLRTFPQAVRVLDTLPGVNQRGAELLVAEWGIDMRRFETAARRAAWSGVAPGNDESAGKQRSGKTRQGHRALRTGLTQWAHAAARTKGT